MGAVFVKKQIYDAFMNGPEHLIEFFHGYTYSGHPVASAAALARRSTSTRKRGCSTRGAETRATTGRTRCTALKGTAARHRHPQHRPGRRDRAGADRRRSRPSAPSRVPRRPSRSGVLIRTTGDIIALSPPLIISKAQIDELVGWPAEGAEGAGVDLRLRHPGESRGPSEASTPALRKRHRGDGFRLSPE